MSSIYLATRPVHVVLETGYDHLYLVYDPDEDATNNNELVIRVGNGSVFWSSDTTSIPGVNLRTYGRFDVEIGAPVAESDDALAGDTPQQRMYTDIDFKGLEINNVWAYLSAHAAAIGNANLPYILAHDANSTFIVYEDGTQNSNSFIASLFKAVGLDNELDSYLAGMGNNNWVGSENDLDGINAPTNGYLINNQYYKLGTGSGDNLTATANGSYVLDGGDGNDVLEGGTGNDKLWGGKDNDEIHGGDGIDTAYYSLPLSSFTFTYNGSYIEVTSTVPGYGTDRIYDDVERIAFVSGSNGPVIISADAVRESGEVFENAENIRVDPLVIDLNRNGSIDLNTSHTVYFDTNNDGFAEAVNWVGAGDGLLARDINDNGTIDNITELFGNANQNGFAALAAFDLNADRIINASDAIWTDLVVWKDTNQNGYSESDELLSLSSLGITAINLYNVQVTSANPSITHNGTITTTDGDIRISNVLFDADATNTRYVGEYTLDIETLFLPTLRGYGVVKDLHIAASMDTSVDSNGDTIKDKMLDLAAMSLVDIASDFAAVKQKIKTLAFDWADVEHAALNSRGTYLKDARELLFLEKYLDNAYYNSRQGGANPGLAQANLIHEAFEKVLGHIITAILVQIASKDLFTDTSYNHQQGEISNSSFSLSETKLEELSDFALALPSTADRYEFWLTIADVIHYVA
jgi:hypothetical protein